MKISNYEFPHSSFLSVEKDMEIIINKMLKDERLKKYLYYTTKDPLKEKNLTQEQSLNLLGKQIKIIPKFTIDEVIKNYIVIGFDTFIPNDNNPEFRDNTISFDIVCNYEQWQLQGLQLRPFKIAAEIDSIFNESRLTGIGKLQFLNAGYININDKFGGISLNYIAIHGEEDKKNLPNPIENEAFEKEFDETWNDN